MNPGPRLPISSRAGVSMPRRPPLPSRITRNLIPLHLRRMPSYGWIDTGFLPLGGQNHESVDNACPPAFGDAHAARLTGARTYWGVSCVLFVFASQRRR
jgi:hypothetical protein